LDSQDSICTQLESLSPDKIQELKDCSKKDILSSMGNNKNILDGGDLGKYVTEIPQVYQDLIQKAIQLSQNVESIGTESIISEN
jgi:hypothetical protein